MIKQISIGLNVLLLVTLMVLAFGPEAEAEPLEEEVRRYKREAAEQARIAEKQKRLKQLEQLKAGRNLQLARFQEKKAKAAKREVERLKQHCP